MFFSISHILIAATVALLPPVQAQSGTVHHVSYDYAAQMQAQKGQQQAHALTDMAKDLAFVKEQLVKTKVPAANDGTPADASYFNKLIENERVDVRDWFAASNPRSTLQVYMELNDSDSLLLHHIVDQINLSSEELTFKATGTLLEG